VVELDSGSSDGGDSTAVTKYAVCQIAQHVALLLFASLGEGRQTGYGHFTIVSANVNRRWQ
jgi:hypothetical protein